MIQILSDATNKQVCLFLKSGDRVKGTVSMVSPARSLVSLKDVRFLDGRYMGPPVLFASYSVSVDDVHSLGVEESEDSQEKDGG